MKSEAAERFIEPSKKFSMKKEYNVVIECSEEGNFAATIPELHDSFPQTHSLDEMLERVKEAIEVSLHNERGEKKFSVPKIQYNLEQLLTKVSEQNIHYEVSTGSPAGKEIW